MSLLIKGMEMPNKKNGAVLIIYPDGRCAFEDGSEYAAVPVPPHGRWNNIIQGIIPSGQCSNCGAWDKVTRFCPNCGSRMECET